MISPYRRWLRDAARSSDAAFAEYVTGMRFPAHLREAERFANAHQRALVLEPRGHAKTTLFIARTARLVGHTKGFVRLGILTAVADDAEARSGAIRALVETPEFADVFPWARGGVRGEAWSDSNWTIAGCESKLGKDYTCFAMGLRSVRAGPRLDILLADDMVGLQENTTESQREHVRQTYGQVVSPMLVPWSDALGSPAFEWFLGTRWHEDDIYATLLRQGIPHLVRKAIQPDGTALWPSYWPLEKLQAKRLELGSAIFDLQYQNDPSGMGGNIFKREWFRYIEHVPEGARRAGMDLNASSKERSDYTALVEVVEDQEHNLYVVGAWRDRLDEGHRAWLTGRLDDMRGDEEPRYGHEKGPRLLWPTRLLPGGFAGHYGEGSVSRALTALNIEATIFQSTFTREVLAKTRLPAMAVFPDKDKVTRARALAARYEAGKVFHLRGAPGIDEYEREQVAFPNGEHDDLVDAGVYAADLGGTEFYFTSGKRG